MPNVPNAHPIAIAISDLHLSLLRPACRNDRNWMATQAYYLGQVTSLSYELNIPVLCAGDIFDRWNPPAELISFALRCLPTGMICVPGQHDLPNHRIDQVHRSGYGCLMQAGKIVDVSGENREAHNNSTKDFVPFRVYGFGWNQEITPPRKSEILQIALIHRYCWTEERKYPGAPEEANVAAYAKQLKGYDVAIFGDNHLRFMASVGGDGRNVGSGCKVVNCGGFMRRKSDEIGRKPAMALIYSDGTVSWKKLDLTLDIFNEKAEERPEVPINMKQFIDGLESLGEQGMDFRAACENHLRNDDVPEAVKQIIINALESHGSPD